MDLEDSLIVILGSARKPGAAVLNPGSGVLGKGGRPLDVQTRRGWGEDPSPRSGREALCVVEGARGDFAVDLSKELLELYTVGRGIRSSGPFAATNTLPAKVYEEPSAVCSNGGHRSVLCPSAFNPLSDDWPFEQNVAPGFHVVLTELEDARTHQVSDRACPVIDTCSQITDREILWF